MSQPRRISIVTGGVPHYRWPFYEAIVDRGVELSVIAAGRLPPGTLAAPSLDPRVSLTHLSRASTGWRGDVLARVRADAPDAILLEHGSSLDFSWTTLLARSIGAPRILWTHGIARQELHGKKRGLPSRGRWLQLRLADGIACYDSFMASVMRTRFPHKVVGVAPNSTDGRPIAAARAKLEAEGVRRLRARLGLPRQNYLLGLGRFVAEKDFRRLLRIGAALRSSGVDVGVVLIGGGPEDQLLRTEGRAFGFELGRDLIFTGPITAPEQLAQWLFAADLCVSPGPLGLSAADCLFAGLPVASYEPAVAGPHHGPEWRYLVPGETGFFAAGHTDGALASVCANYLARPAQAREVTRRACVEYASGQLGVGRMADGMMDVVGRTMYTYQRAG